MEYLIKEAFKDVESLRPHIDAGHYDLLGPQGEIILPHVWETVIEPDWIITMHMWPKNEAEDQAWRIDEVDSSTKTSAPHGTIRRAQEQGKSKVSAGKDRADGVNDTPPFDIRATHGAQNRGTEEQRTEDKKRRDRGHASTVSGNRGSVMGYVRNLSDTV